MTVSRLDRINLCLVVWLILTLSVMAGDGSNLSNDIKDWSMAAVVAWGFWFGITKNARVTETLTVAIQELIVLVKNHDADMRVAHAMEVKQMIATAIENERKTKV